MNKGFIIKDVTSGKLNALVKNIMKQTGVNDPNEAIRLFNSGEYVAVKGNKKWSEKDGVIYFTVTSDGTTGAQWIERLEEKGYVIGLFAKQSLLSEEFKPTNGVTTKVAVLKNLVFEQHQPVSEVITKAAHVRKWEAPNAEIACLIRENFTDDDLDVLDLVSITIMHEPIKDSDGDPGLFRMCQDNGEDSFHRSEFPIHRLGHSVRRMGFAFAVPQN